MKTNIFALQLGGAFVIEWLSPGSVAGLYRLGYCRQLAPPQRRIRYRRPQRPTIGASLLNGAQWRIVADNGHLWIFARKVSALTHSR